MSVDELVLTAGALLSKARASGDRDACRVLERGRDFKPVEAEGFERETGKEREGRGRKAAPRKFFAQPVTDARGSVRRLNPAEHDDSSQLRAVCGIPVACRLSIAHEMLVAYRLLNARRLAVCGS